MRLSLLHALCVRAYHGLVEISHSLFQCTQLLAVQLYVYVVSWWCFRNGGRVRFSLWCVRLETDCRAADCYVLQLLSITDINSTGNNIYGCFVGVLGTLKYIFNEHHITTMMTTASASHLQAIGVRVWLCCESLLNRIHPIALKLEVWGCQFRWQRSQNTNKPFSTPCAHRNQQIFGILISSVNHATKIVYIMSCICSTLTANHTIPYNILTMNWICTERTQKTHTKICRDHVAVIHFSKWISIIYLMSSQTLIRSNSA